jgi:hypothetical protein
MCHIALTFVTAISSRIIEISSQSPFPLCFLWLAFAMIAYFLCNLRERLAPFLSELLSQKKKVIDLETVNIADKNTTRNTTRS